MTLTSAAYALALTLGLIALTLVSYVGGQPLLYLIALPSALCSALITLDLMARHSTVIRRG